jgi:hypothetical protein
MAILWNRSIHDTAIPWNRSEESPERDSIKSLLVYGECPECSGIKCSNAIRVACGCCGVRAASWCSITAPFPLGVSQNYCSNITGGYTTAPRKAIKTA